MEELGEGLKELKGKNNRVNQTTQSSQGLNHQPNVYMGQSMVPATYVTIIYFYFVAHTYYPS